MPASYTIIPDGLTGYGVEVVSPGHFRFVGGFVTDHEVTAWIAEQRAAEVAIAAADRVPRAERASW